jgi:hypothetical protein
MDRYIVFRIGVTNTSTRRTTTGIQSLISLILEKTVGYQKALEAPEGVRA